MIRASSFPAAVLSSCIAAAVLAIAMKGAVADSLPAVHRKGEVSYMSGGIADGEAKAMKRVAVSYPLELEFQRKATPRDQFLQNVKVSIRNVHDRTVLDLKGGGPFLLAVLPAGRYTVTASNRGLTEQRDVQIAPGEHRRVVFEWPQR